MGSLSPQGIRLKFQLFNQPGGCQIVRFSSFHWSTRLIKKLEFQASRFESRFPPGQRPGVFMLPQEAWCEPGLGWETRRNCKLNFSGEALKHSTLTRPTPRSWRRPMSSATSKSRYLLRFGRFPHSRLVKPRFILQFRVRFVRGWGPCPHKASA